MTLYVEKVYFGFVSSSVLIITGCIDSLNTYKKEREKERKEERDKENPKNNHSTQVEIYLVSKQNIAS